MIFFLFYFWFLINDLNYFTWYINIKTYSLRPYPFELLKRICNFYPIQFIPFRCIVKQCTQTDPVLLSNKVSLSPYSCFASLLQNTIRFTKTLGSHNYTLTWSVRIFSHYFATNVKGQNVKHITFYRQYQI